MTTWACPEGVTESDYPCIKESIQFSDYMARRSRHRSDRGRQDARHPQLCVRRRGARRVLHRRRQDKEAQPRGRDAHQVNIDRF